MKERLKIVARINDNNTTRKRLEEEFKQLCRKHATLVMEAARARENAERVVQKRKRKREAKEDEDVKVKKMKTG